MRIPFRLVDVFTDRPLAGNQLCVVPEPVDIPPELMQAVAKEIGFSETAFVSDVGDAEYSLRIFTPGAEMPFAGHPTLGTAFVLVSEGRVTSPVTQHVTAGDIHVDVDAASGFARMQQLRPTFGSVLEDRAAVAAAVGLGDEDLHPGLAPQVVSTGLPHLMVAARDGATVARAVRDRERMGAILERAAADGFYLFALEPEVGPDGARATSRGLFADLGLAEDPATGSAAGPLGAYLAEHRAISSSRLTVSQGIEIGRPSTLIVDVEPEDGSWAIHVGGGVVSVGEGEFSLPSS
jgi:trans-2,3-dihydro-3-hydroxyanthranilate isomerase